MKAQLLDANARAEIKKHGYKLTADDRRELRRGPRLNDLLEKGKVVTETTITEEGGWPSESYNSVTVPLYHVVPAGFNNKLMCFQQQSKSCRRRVRVTIELV